MELTREAALQYIHENPEAYLQRARVEGYICPICGSGSGPKGTGLKTKDKIHFSCFGKGECFKSIDIPDIIAMEEGLQPGSREALQRAYDLYGITIKGEARPSSTGQAKTRQTDKPAERDTMQEAKKPILAAEKQPEEKDYTEYFKQCHARIAETNYPAKRGLSLTIKRFQLGYDAEFKIWVKENNGEWKQKIWGPALIIPNGPNRFIARNTNPEAKERYRFSPGPKQPFNLQALQGEKPVFIVEGWLDALSIIEAGGEAVALGGKDGKQLLAALEKTKPAQPLILALDKDEAGQAGEEKLAATLKKQGIPFIQADITGEYKDANEAWNGPGAADFVKAIYNAQQAIKTEQEEALEAERAAYMKNNAAASMEAFLSETAKPGRYFTTGFSQLDEELKGGIFEGRLVIVGALPSTGKTTLTMQIADSMAQAGHDVLIFSLETGKHEIMAKSISRETLVHCFTHRMPATNAIGYMDILNGRRDEVVTAACQAYLEYAGNVTIFQSLGKIGTARIREELQRHIALFNKTPVIFVDYLQLLGPNDTRQYSGAKEVMDAAVTELKCIAVDYKTPVILISSFNRDNYKTDANFSSFKESGGIEYSADILLGLQYVGAGKDGWNQETAEKLAAEPIRKMELKIMKHRGGGWGQRIEMDYYAFANFFKATGIKKK